VQIARTGIGGVTHTSREIPMTTKTSDLGAQIAGQRERLSETVGSLAEKIGEIDAHDLRARAESGASELLENVTGAEGHPKRGLLLGAVAVLVALVLLRKFLR